MAQSLYAQILTSLKTGLSEGGDDGLAGPECTVERCFSVGGSKVVPNGLES
jgi:hypothetical protein